MNLVLISLYFLRIIISTSFCKGQDGYSYTRPTGKPFFPSDEQQTEYSNREKINTNLLLPNYLSNRYEINYQMQNPASLAQPPQIVQLTRPAIREKEGQPNFGAGKSTRDSSFPASNALPLESSTSNHPNLSRIPATKFSCDSQTHSGYFADVETHCQLFHICANGIKYDFLCPNETVFDQRYFICTERDRFDCEAAESRYDSKENLLDEDEAGNLIAHAAGATGAQGPSAIYSPPAGIFPLPMDSDPVTKSNGLISDSLNSLGDKNTSYSHLTSTTAPVLSTDNQSVPGGADLNLSNSSSSLADLVDSEKISTPEPVDSFFISSLKPTVRSEVPSHHEPVFSLHGQLITYKTPFEPERSPKIMRWQGQYERAPYMKYE